MGQGDPTLELVTDLVCRMAGRQGRLDRLRSMLEVLTTSVEGDLGLVVQAEGARTTVCLIGSRTPPGTDEALARELELLAGDPLLDPVRQGDLTPRTAEREFGRHRWHTSPQRAGCLRLCGVDQVCTLPLAAGPHVVIAMFARRGADFTDAHLRHLTGIQPFVAAVVALAGLERLPTAAAPRPRPHLTGRERQVLALLADGHTCARIARALGASPRTVEAHLARIYTKLGVRDRLSAVLAAYDLALIPPRPSAGAESTTA